MNGTGEKAKNSKNRWIFTTQSETDGFKRTMLAVSFTALFELVLLYTLGGFFGGLFERFMASLLNINYTRTVDAPAMEELIMLLNNVERILVSVFSLSFSGLLFMYITNNGKYRKTDTSITFKPRLPKNCIVLIIIGLSIVYLFSNVAAVFDLFLDYFGIAKAENFFYIFPQTLPGIIVYFIAVVIVPSLFEEFLFRYLILNSLVKYGNLFAITVSSLLFGFLHSSTSAFFFATALGMFSAYIAIKTKSMWFSIILHAAVNAMSFVFEYLANSMTEADADMTFIIYLNIILAVSLISVLGFIKKRRSTELAEHRNYIYINRRTKIAGFFNILSIVFFVIVIFISSLEYYFKVVAML